MILRWLHNHTNFDLADILEAKGITLYEQGKEKEAGEYFAAAQKLNPLSLKIGSYLNSKKQKEN